MPQQHSRSELDALTYDNLPNNTAGVIDPAKLREVLLSLIASQLNLLDDGNPGAGSGAPAPGQQQATFGNLGGQAQDNVSLVNYLAGLGRTLLEFSSPLLTQARQWYVTNTGIWEAKSSFNAQAPPAAGAYWRLVVGFGDALTATAAGRALLAAPTALAQRKLLDIFSVAAGQYGTGQPAFTNAYEADGVLVYLLGQAAYLRTQLVSLASPIPPVLPMVTGFLPDSAELGASITLTGTGFTKATAVAFNGTPASFQVLNATTIVAVVAAGATTGPIAVTNAAGTGTSTASFTVSASPVVTPPTPDLTAALALSLAQITLGGSVGYSINASGGATPYGYAVVATSLSTGASYQLGTTKSGTWQPPAVDQYQVDATVTDDSSPAKVVQTATRYLNVVAAANRIPVANAGQDVTIQLPTSAVALMGTASDLDPGDTLTYLWRQIIGPSGAGTATGIPATSLNVVASNLTVGTYQFGFQATDQKGGKSPEDFVVVTVNAAASQTAFVITNGDMSRNLRNDGTTRRSALCGLLFSSDATSATVEYENTQAVSAADQFGISLEIGGVSSLFKLAKGVGTFSDTFAIAGGGGAVQLLEFLEGVQEASSGDQAPFGYTTIKKVTFNAGSTSSKTKSAVGNDVAVALTDSKGVGVYASNPAQTSWVPKLRRLRPSLALYSDGHGNAKISVQLATDATQNALLDLYAPVWSGQNVPRLIVALGENDKNQGGDPTTELARVAALADKFHARYPGGLFYYELLYANATGNVAAWRTAGTNSKGSRGDWYRFIDPGSPQLADPYHPTDSGYTTVAQAYHAGLDAVPAALATPVLLDASDSRNTQTVWYDSGTGGHNASLVGAPALVANAVFGKAAYYFPDDNKLRYAELQPVASQAGSYTITVSLRSLSAKHSQFVFDCALGRIVVALNGFDPDTIGAGAYYASTQNSQASGARGSSIDATKDVVITVALGTDNGVVYLNGVKQGVYPVSITRLNSVIRLGAASDQTSYGVGSFFGYLQAMVLAPGKFTDQQALDKYTQLSSGGTPTPQPVSGVLTFEAAGLSELTNDQYTTTGAPASGNYDVLAVSPLVFPAGQECAVGLTMADGDGDVVLGFSTSSTAPTGPGDVQYGFLFSAADKQLLIAKSGSYAGLAALAAGERARVRRAADGALYLERSANGTTWTQVSNYSSSTAAGRLYAFFVAKSAPTTRATAPRYLTAQ